MRPIRDRTWSGVLLALLVLADTANAQMLPASPSRTLCKQWDDAYLSSFTTGLWACVVGTLILALLAGLLGRWFWLAAAPRLRILVSAFLVFALVELGIVALPWMIGFGWLWFSPIDTAYFDCIPLGFGAQGFFGGLIGTEIAAVSQWPTMTYLLLGAAGAAGLLAWLISELVARFFGLRHRARGEGA